MSSKSKNREAKLYSIGVFEDSIPTKSGIPTQSGIPTSRTNNTSDPDRHMTLEEYENFVDENGEIPEYLDRQSADDLGTRLELLGLLADMSEVTLVGKTTFKEFLLAGLRKIASSYSPHNQNSNKVDTYEFDAPKFGSFSAYVQTMDYVTNNAHRRVIAVVVSGGDYPRSLSMTVADRILQHTITLRQKDGYSNNSRKFVDRKIAQLIKEFYTARNVNKVQKMRESINDTTEVMKGNVEKLEFQGDDLDDLVARSQDLSNRSKTFYRKARKLNACSCTLL